ncbi:hypothetical protein PLESTB_001484500 [Pleodorina starrii]|uniref:Uncharacterized protein n=1 Tax=Pleodorina starrii TaxID=330485 RepID=A0A9W6BWD1_9CHLO|nr:hypothetical protein PLESTB_001484500 [Pleodorina starrii]
MRKAFADRHAAELGPEAKEKVEAQGGLGYIHGLSMQPFAVVTRTYPALAAFTAMFSELGMDQGPVMIDSCSNQIAAPPGATGKVYTTNAVCHGPEGAVIDGSRHQQGHILVLQRMFHIYVGATAFRDFLLDLGTALARMHGDPSGATRMPKLILTDDCKATRKGLALADGFK